MTETGHRPPPTDLFDTDDRTLPIVVYGLYLAGFLTAGLTAVAGVILAYANRGDSEFTWRESHYDFAIRTFWLFLAGVVISSLLIVVGIPLLIVLVGIIPIIVGGVALSLIGVWFAVRTILGLVYAVRGDAYPRPRNLLA